MAHEALLAATPFFASAPADVIARVAEFAHTRDLVRGDILFREGEAANALYVVIKGRIAITIENKPVDSRESVVALMDKGDLFGDMGLLDTGVRSANARALEPTTVLEVPYPQLQKELKESPELLWGVTTLLVQRLRAMDEALADSVFLDVTGRTAKRLLELSEGRDEFSLPITQEELAGMVGASRERVNKAIASFIKLGWLTQSDRRYSITQRAKLEARAR